MEGTAMKRNCRTARDSIRAKAEETAAAIIARSRTGETQSAALEPEEPMKHYVHPVPHPASSDTPNTRLSAPPALDQNLHQIQEALCYQNQLLLDLLAAVNSLTAAVLNVKNTL